MVLGREALCESDLETVHGDILLQASSATLTLPRSLGASSFASASSSENKGKKNHQVVHYSQSGRHKTVPALRAAGDADANFVHDVQMDETYFVALQQEPGSDVAHEPEHIHEKAEAAETEHLNGESLEEIKRSMHLAVAAMLLGFVAFIMALFYLVNFPDLDIVAATWRLLSTTMSIFLAVLMFSSTQHIVAVFTGRHERDGEGEVGTERRHESTVAVGHEMVTRELLMWTFWRFICFWMVLQVYTYFVHGKSILLKAVAKLGSHIVAFAGMDAFGTLQEYGAFSSQGVFYMEHCVLALMAFGSLLWCAFHLADMGRSHIAMRSSDPEAQKEWLSECRAAEHEAAGLILGLLSSQCIRYAIVGSLPPLEGGSPMGKSMWQVHALFVIAVALGLIVVPMEMVLTKFTAYAATLGPAQQSWNKVWRSLRFARVIRETLSMTMAWCLMYWGRWAFWMSTENNGLGYGDKMTALLTTSLFMSAFCFLGLLLIEFAADRVLGQSGLAGLIALGNALGLVMGLSWESTFHEAVEGIGDLHLLPIGYTLNVLVLIFVLLVVTLPAWLLYILPEALKERKEGCHWTEENEL